jgi:hypothetical protein
MGMRLQDAINFASDPANGQPFGLATDVVVTMHDDTETVLFGTVSDESILTFRPDIPLRNWGTGTISRPGSVGRFNRQIPGFSTRGQAGLMMNVALASAVPLATPTPIHVSVRLDPGFQLLRFLGSGPSVQIEIDKLTTLGGTATSGVTLQATEDGALLRAIGPSLRDPATIASYTVTLRVSNRIG